MIRDAVCIVSGAPYDRCEAAQLAPKHREDVSTFTKTSLLYSDKRICQIYSAILGDDHEVDADMAPYESSAAVLLATGLHRSYDQFVSSFFTQVSRNTICVSLALKELLKGDKLVYHSFNDQDASAQYHGKVINPETAFRIVPANRITSPDARLIDWHYAQCCRMRIRGFSAGQGSD